ncbi:MAG: hypothetical protein QNJ15_06380 [Erythrobacter sp.]|nr:hypothetical protein [Erythrobacter sp.]
MATLRIYAELLKHPVGWIGALALFAVNAVVFHYVDRAIADYGYFSFRAVTELVGLATYAAFAFPVVRIMLKGAVAMERPRWATWTVVSILLSVIRVGLAVLGLTASIVFLPDSFLYLDYEWQEFLIETLIIPFFLGVFVWETALICGRHAPTLGESTRFVWQRRGGILLLYFAISSSDFFVSYWLTYALEQAEPWVVDAAFSVRYAFYSWCLSLLSVALFVDLVQSATRVEEEFA